MRRQVCISMCWLPRVATCRFHAEVAKVEEEFAGVMDCLAVEAATGIHSTKKERTVDTA